MGTQRNKLLRKTEMLKIKKIMEKPFFIKKTNLHLFCF